MKNTAKIDEETGEVLEEGYYCDDECSGCACHWNPPCSHCVDHSYQQGENIYEDKE